jgi:hypothetical protein
LLEDVYALPRTDRFSGISSNRTGVVVSVLELLAARVSRASFAFRGLLILAANDAGIRLDDEYGTAYNGR